MKPGDTVLFKLRNGARMKGFVYEYGHHPDYVPIKKPVRVRATNVGRNRKAHVRNTSYFIHKSRVFRTRIVLIEKNKSK